MSNLFKESVLSVHHWTDTLFSFSTTRDPSFRFASGQFTMIGLEVEGRPLLRAYSISSAHYDDNLEFLSIKVPDGPLTSRLKNLKEGDQILVGRKPTGTLITDNILSGRTLYLLGTGTGLAPFLSLIRDPDVYGRFDKVVLAHGCRHAEELAYRRFLREELPNHEYLGEDVRAKLLYYPTVTRGEFATMGRLTDLVRSGRMFSDLGLERLDAAEDRVMLCGNPSMLQEMTQVLEAEGFEEGSHSRPGQYVIEKAFVER